MKAFSSFVALGFLVAAMLAAVRPVDVQRLVNRAESTLHNLDAQSFFASDPPATPELSTAEIGSLLAGDEFALDACKGWLIFQSCGSVGTGAFVAWQNAHAGQGPLFLTAGHVCATYQSQFTYPFRPVAYLGQQDLCLLTAAQAGPADNPVSLQSGTPTVGEHVYTRCMAPTPGPMLSGDVTSIGPAEEAGVPNAGPPAGTWVWTDIVVHPGCSGSPLLGANGQLLGVMVRSTSDGSIAAELPHGLLP